MLKLGLICNSTAAFPLIHWLKSQSILNGIAVLEQKSDFIDDISVLSKNLGIELTIISKKEIDNQLITWQSSISAELVLVLAFPAKIKKVVFDQSKYGFFNIHFGKLPEYGGSFPIFWQKARQEKSGVLTIHKMDEGYDTGPIAVEVPFDISQHQTFGMVENIYSVLTINGVYQLLNGILSNTLILKNQTNKSAKYLAKPSLNDLIINWKGQSVIEIVALIKATNPWNRGAIARINNLEMKIIEAEIWENLATSKPGEIIEINEKGLRVGCKNGESINIKITYSPLGYLEAGKLGAIGLKIGDKFDDILK
jgi:methionyl-tRNA formyltransferase